MATWVGLGLAAVGGLCALWGYNRYRYRSALAAAASPGEGAAGDGAQVGMTGEVHPVDGVGTTTAPLSGEECLLAAWDVERHGEDSHPDLDYLDDGDRWGGDVDTSGTVVAAGFESVPFRVEGETGAVRVDPDAAGGGSTLPPALSTLGTPDHSVTADGVALDFPHLPLQHRVEPGETREEVSRFRSSVAGLSAQRDNPLDPKVAGEGVANQGFREYSEATIQPGDEVYLLGTLDSAADGAAEGTQASPAVTAGGDAPLLVSTRSPADLRSAARFGLPAFVLGLLTLGLGLLVAAGVV